MRDNSLRREANIVVGAGLSKVLIHSSKLLRFIHEFLSCQYKIEKTLHVQRMFHCHRFVFPVSIYFKYLVCIQRKKEELDRGIEIVRQFQLLRAPKFTEIGTIADRKFLLVVIVITDTPKLVELPCLSDGFSSSVVCLFVMDVLTLLVRQLGELVEDIKVLPPTRKCKLGFQMPMHHILIE